MEGDKLSAEELSELLEQLARGLKELYGGRYRGLVLYGSYARGEADEGSDVDVLLLLDGEVDVAQEIIRAEEVKWPLSLEAGYTISLLPVSRAYYQEAAEPFLRNVHREGVAVA